MGVTGTGRGGKRLTFEITSDQAEVQVIEGDGPDFAHDVNRPMPGCLVHRIVKSLATLSR